MLLAPGCGVISRMSQPRLRDLGEAAAERGDICRVVGEAVGVAADWRQAVGIDDVGGSTPPSQLPQRQLSAARRMARSRRRRSGAGGRADDLAVGNMMPTLAGGKGLSPPNCGSRCLRLPGRQREIGAAAIDIKVAPVRRCSSASPPTWSKCSWLMPIRLTSLSLNPSALDIGGDRSAPASSVAAVEQDMALGRGDEQHGDAAGADDHRRCRRCGAAARASLKSHPCRGAGGPVPIPRDCSAAAGRERQLPAARRDEANEHSSRR